MDDERIAAAIAYLWPFHDVILLSPDQAARVRRDILADEGGDGEEGLSPRAAAAACFFLRLGRFLGDAEGLTRQLLAAFSAHLIPQALASAIADEARKRGVPG